MKKIIAAICALAAVFMLVSCANNNSTATPDTTKATGTPSATATQQASQEPTSEPTATRGHFQDLASLDLVREVAFASAEKTVFVYDYEPGYEGKKIKGFTVEQVTLSGEDLEYSVSMDKDAITVNGHEYIVSLDITGAFEIDEIYPFTIKLTVTYEDDSTASITDFFSYQIDSFT